jgi:membrane associated rhomboid family serine protease
VIPLRDTVPRRRVPLVTWLLIALNAAVFLWELSLGARSGTSLATWGFVPARFLAHAPGGAADLPARLLPLVTSMFLHAGWLHLLGNMLYLHIFGDNVEDALGHLPFLGFYLLSGAASALVQALAAPSSEIPMVGASGAIAGVLGAYFVLYPNARVVTLLPLVVFIRIVEVPSFFFLLFWFLLQFLSGAISLGSASAAQGGVAWWAHVGGFAAGLALGLLVRVSRAAGRGRRRG